MNELILVTFWCFACCIYIGLLCQEYPFLYSCFLEDQLKCQDLFDIHPLRQNYNFLAVFSEFLMLT